MTFVGFKSSDPILVGEFNTGIFHHCTGFDEDQICTKPVRFLRKDIFVKIAGPGMIAGTGGSPVFQFQGA